MKKITIKKVTKENIDDLNSLCVPVELSKNCDFIKGISEKKKWAFKMLSSYGKFAKLAYIESNPVGLIQYELHPRERIVQIRCVFVPKEEHQQERIATRLLEYLIRDIKESWSLFEHLSPLALVTYAFETPSGYPQRLFFQKRGFKRADKDNPFVLYYPIKEGFIYILAECKDPPKKEEEKKVLILFDPFCPWAIFFSNKMKKAIREIATGIPIEAIDISDYPDKKEINIIHKCIVNGKSIKSFVLEKEKFQEEVREALKI